MKSYRKTAEILDEISQKLYKSNYADLKREKRDVVFAEFLKEVQVA